MLDSDCMGRDMYYIDNLSMLTMPRSKRNMQRLKSI
jgi:hypothetical protein